jgi:hypothetical protein
MVFYLYPLAERTDSSLRAFDEFPFHKEFPARRLQSFLRSSGVARLYELREYRDGNYLMSTDCWEPCYNGAEVFWFSEALDWIMYESHESSITTGGTLTGAILWQWKDSDQYAWSQHIND